MEFNKNDFIRDCDAINTFYNKKDNGNCIKSIKKCLELVNPFDLECVIKDKNTTFNQLCTIGDALMVMFEYAIDDITQTEIANVILALYAKAFKIAPKKDKYLIAYNFNLFVNKTYYEHYNTSGNVTFYCCFLGEFLEELYIGGYDDYPISKECSPIYKSIDYHTKKGKINVYQQRISKLIQWYIWNHIKNVQQTNPSYLPVISIDIQKEIDECYSYLCNIDKRLLKKLANQILIDYLCDEDGEYSVFMESGFVFDEDEDKIVLEKEYLWNAEKEFQEYLNEQAASSDDNYDEEYNGYGRYRGSYAQDEMGYSDDDIDTIFDGDPSAYWNID